MPPAQLVAKDGVICDRQNPDAQITYGQLAKGQKIERHLNGKPTLKEVSQFKVMGKPVLRRDARDKVTGKAKYPATSACPACSTRRFCGRRRMARS